MPHFHTLRKGTDLKDPQAHQKDHQSWSRRSFLQTIGLAGATSVGLSFLPVTSMYGFPLANALGGTFSNRKLVLIRLKGGNDGLNTFVPMYDYDRYRNFRPSLGHLTNNLITLNEDFAMPTAMNALKPMWDNGKMRVINSVGYPDHNLSHFTGADIMASGDSDLANNSDGWLARYYTALNPNYIEEPATDPPAVKIGGPTSILFNDENKVDLSANFASADKLEDLVQSGTLFDNINSPDNCYYGDQVLFLRTIANAASIYSNAIFEAYNNSQTEAAYTSSLGEQLKLVARLIKGGLTTQLYLVTLDGFDTHVAQNGLGNHLGLLENLSTAVDAFYEDLADGGFDNDVLSMTYSEFGRRVMENGFSGTDHGTALPVMMFGPALDGADTHGKNPDLADLDGNGNLKHGTDFRSIYATLLENWFCIDNSQVNEILGESYERLTDIGINCAVTSQRNTKVPLHLNHGITPIGAGQYQVFFTLPKGTDVSLELFTISGRMIQEVATQYFHQGRQVISFSIADLNVELVPMVYTIRIDGKPYSGQFVASSH